MGRSGYTELVESIKQQYKVPSVYSYSQVKTFVDDPYEYYLRYVIHAEPDILEDSPYGLCGTLVHDIIEKFQQGLITREAGVSEFYTKFKEIMTKDTTKPFSTIDDLNMRMATNFQIDIVNYLKNMTKAEGKIKCEDPMICYLKNDNQRAAFAGYIDFLKFNKDGTIMILDYKTSSMYKKDDIPEYANQLYLYAEAVKQKYQKTCDDIIVGWNFLKYAKVINRNDLSEEIIERSKLSEFGDLSDYTVEDCIITVDFTEKTEEQFIDSILVKIKNIESAYERSNNGEDDSPYMYTAVRSNISRLELFSKYSTKLHKPWRIYCENAKSVV